MALLNVCWIFVALSLQNIFTEARPSFCGDVVEPCGGLGGGLGGLGGLGGVLGGLGGIGGGWGGFGGLGGGCAPTQPISFLPVPQPLPIRVPVPPKQSVTIPNIILALLPPNNKPPCPRPIIRPPPVVVPVPQPYPCRVPSYDCGC